MLISFHRFHREEIPSSKNAQQACSAFERFASSVHPQNGKAKHTPQSEIHDSELQKRRKNPVFMNYSFRRGCVQTVNHRVTVPSRTHQPEIERSSVDANRLVVEIIIQWDHMYMYKCSSYYGAVLETETETKSDAEIDVRLLTD